MAKGNKPESITRNKDAGLDPADIREERDMVSDRGRYQDSVDQILSVARDLKEQYGDDGLIGQFLIATLAGKGYSVIGYYDGENIGMNARYMNTQAIADAYEECVKSGFHPSSGNKTATEAVAAHEYGHAMTDAVGRKLGIHNIDAAATRIVNEARRETKHRGVVQMANAISRYATTSNAEAVAEAFSDVYCNGRNAKPESRAIVNVMNKYLKK